LILHPEKKELYSIDITGGFRRAEVLQRNDGMGNRPGILIIPDHHDQSANMEYKKKLNKKLGFFDVYVICTGALISSGFFLLPGLAAAVSGPSVFIAYLIASFFVIPATLAVAELSTAMPKAGGSYFFINRSFGHLMGTIGGIGDWIMLVLKSAFALIGMGAYFSFIFDLPVQPVAVILALLFTIINILGAKESARFQQFLVTGLVLVMIVFIINGFWWIGENDFTETIRKQMIPFFPFGVEAMISAVGIIFVSYGGLSQVASVAEEVNRPERNIPLGMAASLLTVTLIYVLGVFVMVAVLPEKVMHENLTPVATAGKLIFSWMPGNMGIILIVFAAMGAFSSTGNAGLMAASRINFAMARDGLLPKKLSKVSRFDTPTWAILFTAAAIIAAIVYLDVETLAGLASVFILFIFALVNTTLIIMRESRIKSYVPVFKVPLYPWLPLLGIVMSVGMIIVLGKLYILFLMTIILISIIWYRIYASGQKVNSRGAIYNVFERLARYKNDNIERELWTVVKERGPTEEDMFDAIVSRAIVIDIKKRVNFNIVLKAVKARLEKDLDVKENLLMGFKHCCTGPGGPPIIGSTVFIDFYLPFLDHPRMALVKLRRGIDQETVAEVMGFPAPKIESSARTINAAVFLVSPKEKTGQHLRILGELISRAEDPEFLKKWQQVKTNRAIRELFLRKDRSVMIGVHQDGPTAELVGKRIEEMRLPADSLVGALYRKGEHFYPRPDEVLQDQDHLIIVGEPKAVRRVYERYNPLSYNEYPPL
jgi:basic amino acid/polyamine antiporter, APA family